MRQNRLTLLALAGILVTIPAGLILLSYGFLDAEACVPQLPGRCSTGPGYITELVGLLVLSVSLQVPLRAVWGLWRESTNRSRTIAATGAVIVGGALAGYSLYRLGLATGLIVANYPCGTYSSPYSCLTLDPTVPILFVFGGSVLAFAIFAVFERIRAL